MTYLEIQNKNKDLVKAFDVRGVFTPVEKIIYGRYDGKVNRKWTDEATQEELTYIRKFGFDC